MAEFSNKNDQNTKTCIEKDGFVLKLDPVLSDNMETGDNSTNLKSSKERKESDNDKILDKDIDDMEDNSEVDDSILDEPDPVTSEMDEVVCMETAQSNQTAVKDSTSSDVEDTRASEIDKVAICSEVQEVDLKTQNTETVNSDIGEKLELLNESNTNNWLGECDVNTDKTAESSHDNLDTETKDITDEQTNESHISEDKEKLASDCSQALEEQQEIADDESLEPIITHGQIEPAMTVDECANDGFGQIGDAASSRNSEDEETRSEMGAEPRKRRRRGSLVNDGDNEELYGLREMAAEDIFEYQWPQDKGGEWYILQEQISEYLGVKSFKRKYPELVRRPVDINERLFLKEKGIVTETQCDLGLSPLKADEVHDVMHKDYPAKYEAYMKVLHDKQKTSIKDQHKEYQMPKVAKDKLAAYTKKAIKAASEFNSAFMREYREERKAYFDLQTFAVHYPTGKMKKVPEELTAVGPYPVALIPGQFQNFYKSYTPQELKYFPVKSALYDSPKFLTSVYVDPAQHSESDSDESSSSKSPDSGSSNESGSHSDSSEDKIVPDSTCNICGGDENKNREGVPEELVACAECSRSGHPSCFELTNEMIPIIKTYPWQCMECKTCVKCMDPYDEDKMMFCDHCDRGYHTFCVGLKSKSIPTGRWECPSCIPDVESKPKRTRTR